MTLMDHSLGQLTTISCSWLYSPDEKREKLPFGVVPILLCICGSLGLFLSLKYLFIYSREDFLCKTVHVSVK